MTPFRLLVPALCALIAFSTCQNDPRPPTTAAPAPAASRNAQQVAYICPMDCEKGKTYDQPGSCPVCKMALEVATSEQLRHADTEIAAAVETTNLPTGDPNKILEAEVNALHDQVMKESSEMERLGRQIKAEFKTVQDATQRKAYIQAISQISQAGFDMMAWMRDYRAPNDLSADEAGRYLREQKTKMIRIQAAVRKAMANGKQLSK